MRIGQHRRRPPRLLFPQFAFEGVSEANPGSNSSPNSDEGNSYYFTGKYVLYAIIRLPIYTFYVHFAHPPLFWFLFFHLTNAPKFPYFPHNPHIFVLFSSQIIYLNHI